MRPLLRRLGLVLFALLVAALGMLAARQRGQTVRVELGDAGDAGAAASGWHEPERRWGLAGRWTDGHGVIATPRVGRHATSVRVALCAHPARGADQVRIGTGPLDVAVLHLAPGCQAIDVPVRLAPADTALTIDLASAATSTPGDPRGLGLFVDWVEVRVDGPDVAWQRAGRTAGLITLLVAAAMLAAWDAAAIATGTRLAGPIVGALLTGVVAWTALALLVPPVLDIARGAAWAVGLAALVGIARAWRPAAGRAAAPASIAWAGVALLGALAVLFRDAIVDGRVLSQSNLLYQVFPWRAMLPADYVTGNRLMADIPLVFYPFLVQVRDAFAAWTFPLWSSRLYTGHPFFASFQSATLSPFTWIAVAVPLPWGTIAGAAARLLIAGTGALAFARRIGLGTAASAFCAVAFALNTFCLVWLEHPPSAVAAWLPWLLWGAERLAHGRDGRAAAGLAILVSLTVFAGHPETALKVLALGGLYGVMTAATSAQPWRAGGWLLVAYGLGVALTAVQVVPFAEYLGESRVQRIRQTITTNPYYLPGEVLVTAAVPDFWGHPVAEDYIARTNRIGVPTNYAEQQIYPGVVTWVLAAVGLAAWRRRWRVAFFLAAAVVSASFAFSVPTAVEHVISLPVLRITMVSRFALLLVFSAIVLAAFGIDALVRTPAAAPPPAEAPRPPRALGWVAGMTAAALAAGMIYAIVRFRADLTGAGLLLRATTGSLFAVGLAATTWALVQGRAAWRIGRGVFGIGVCGLVAAELLAFASGFRTYVRPSEVFRPIEGVEAVRRDPGLFRVLGVGQVLPANTAMAYGLADPRGYDGMGPNRLSELLDVSLTFMGSYHQLGHAERSPLVNLLNVKYVFARPGQALSAPQFTPLPAGGSPVFVNHAALPRAFLTDGVTILAGNAARRAIRDGQVDFRRVTILEAAPPPGSEPEPATGDVGSVTVRHYRERLVEITTQATGRRLLVLTDLFFPGWQADVDGRPAPILLANFAFRAVSVPAGAHTVRFVYAPRSFTWGLAVSTLAGAALIVVAWVGRARKV